MIPGKTQYSEKCVFLFSFRAETKCFSEEQHQHQRRQALLGLTEALIETGSFEKVRSLCTHYILILILTWEQINQAQSCLHCDASLVGTPQGQILRVRILCNLNKVQEALDCLADKFDDPNQNQSQLRLLLPALRLACTREYDNSYIPHF